MPITKKASIKNYSLVNFFVAALISSIFFDDPHLYFYKRVVYLIFLYFFLFQLMIFNYRREETRFHVPMPAFYAGYITIFLIFIAVNLIVDLNNPAFNLITILNHPLALMAVMPVFAFKVGYQTSDDDKVFNILFYISIAFLIFFLFPLKGNNVYNASLTCYASVLPFFAFTLVKKKYRVYAFILLGLGFLLSTVSESRTIILRVLLFGLLFISLSMVKKYSSLKILIICAISFFMFEMLTNLQNFIDFFIADTGAKKFDDSDTRTFLYEELFGDMKTHELFMGRGFLGHYFSPYFLDQMQQGIADGDSFSRISIEVGFLELLLKGGFVYYFLYITPLVISCCKGLGAHQNKLSFSISVIILTELLIMFIENIPVFSFPFVLLFFLAGFSYRRMNKIDVRPIATSRPGYILESA
ncbi:MAG: hypothetical protein M3N30_08420 [Bacteroidota bacterium]|nr:hypothetical protein [Bacteroidota bacterium]